MKDQVLVNHVNCYLELCSILRRFNRDDMPTRRQHPPSGEGVLVFITYTQANQIRNLVQPTKEVRHP